MAHLTRYFHPSRRLSIFTLIAVSISVLASIRDRYDPRRMYPGGPYRAIEDYYNAGQEIPYQVAASLVTLALLIAWVVSGVRRARAIRRGTFDDGKMISLR